MKKIFAWLLLLAMVFSMTACGDAVPASVSDTAELQEVPAVQEEAPAEEVSPEPEDSSDGLPKAGETIEGFTVVECRDFPLVGGTAVLFEHDKTGAKLLYIANSDTNRVYDLTFLTRAIDNTGLPHVFEHSTLDGSEKYPSKSLFFNLSYQTYNTYMNAYTQSLLTGYPVASLSEEQLLKYADYYTDSCLHPMILEDESIFREEAWRYRLADAKDDLTIEGTVYSEMQGAMDLTSTALLNASRTAYPGSMAGNEYGGEPEHIPEMTFEALRNYHDLYYHPSNCIVFLYGSFKDYTRFLKLADEAFSPYEKREFLFEDEGYEPLTESVEASFTFPVESSSDTVHSSAFFYTFLCPGLSDDLEEETVLNTLTDLLAADGSPLIQRLKSELPHGTFGTYIDIDGPDDSLVFYGMNVDPEDGDTFRTIVREVLDDIAANGFSEELADSVASNLLMTIRLTPENSGYGVDVISDLASYYASSRDVFGYLSYLDGMARITEWNTTGRYSKAVNKWLGTDAVTAYSVTVPEAGLREQLDAAEAARLAEVKASMSEEEIAAIIEATLAPDEEDDASAYVAQLQAETAETLPEEIRLYNYTDESGSDGERYINVEADVDGVGQVVLLFDASGLNQDEIHWFKLYTELLGDLDTAETSSDDLAVRMIRYFYNGEIRLSIANDRESGSFVPRLRAGWTAADEDLDEGYALLYEILFETDFTDTDTILGLISRYKASLKSEITSSPYSTMLYRMRGAYSPLYRYYSYFHGLDYYAFLEELETEAAADSEILTEQLQAVQDYFCNRTNTTAIYVGSQEGFTVNQKPLDLFMDKLDVHPVDAVEYDLPAPEKNEALIVDSTVQYNGIVADYETIGLTGFSGEMDAVSALVNDAYLYPVLRDGYGAYGVFSGFVEDDGAYVLSYRDPNVAETFEAYEEMPAFIKELEISQEELDGYILSSYSYYAAPQGELAGAVETALDLVTGDAVDQNLTYMRQLKTLTPEMLIDYSEAFEKLVEDGYRFTAGGAAAINAEADRYDVILNPFSSVDLTAVELEDVPEKYKHYEAVRFNFENLLMFADENNVFGVDETATVGDLCGALYALIGEDGTSQYSAIYFLQQYGIVSKDYNVSDELTGPIANEILNYFTQAIGEDYTYRMPYKKAVTRGELADIIMSYYDSLPEE